MSSRRAEPQRGYYFALPRLWAFLSGRDAKRNDQNRIEAYLVGVVVFFVSYATCITMFGAGVLFAIAVVFVTWMTWLAVFYLNSLLVNGVRDSGLFTHITNSHAQSVLIGSETTVCAIALTTQRGWSLLGWSWLLLTFANVAAAAALHLMTQRNA